MLCYQGQRRGRYTSPLRSVNISERQEADAGIHLRKYCCRTLWDGELLAQGKACLPAPLDSGYYRGNWTSPFQPLLQQHFTALRTTIWRAGMGDGVFER